MTDAEIESVARRYAGYCGLRISRCDSIFKLRIGDFLFTSYVAFLFGTPDMELPYNDLVKMDSSMKSKTLEYSSAEELDFKLSAMGF